MIGGSESNSRIAPFTKPRMVNGPEPERLTAKAIMAVSGTVWNLSMNAT